MTEQELWDAYFKNRSRENQERLFRYYAHERKLVKRIAYRVLSVAAGVQLTIEDLQSYGELALWQRIATYDPAHGVRFMSYAGARIKGAMIDGIRTADWIPRRIRDEQKQGSGAPEILSFDAVENCDPCSTDCGLQSVEQSDDWRNALRYLDHRKRRAFRLLWIEGLNLTDAARRLGISPAKMAVLRDEIFARLVEATDRGRRQVCQPSGA